MTNPTNDMATADTAMDELAELALNVPLIPEGGQS